MKNPTIIPETVTPAAVVPTIISGELNLMSLTCEGEAAAGQILKVQAVLENLTGTPTKASLSRSI